MRTRRKEKWFWSPLDRKGAVAFWLWTWRVSGRFISPVLMFVFDRPLGLDRV